MPSPSAPAPLHLTVRFSTSLPDIHLDIPLPQRTSVLALKLLLRTRLSSCARLRFIHQGRILADSAALSTIKPTSPPPQSSPQDAKGKAAAVPAARVYLNCAIGPDLSPQELAAEEAAAQNPPCHDGSLEQARRTATAQRPRGFDRLRSAGFSHSEISTLRTQFASVYADRFPPDAPPSPDSQRRMEDAWIDNNAADLPSASTGSPADDAASMSSVLDVLIRGMMIGFFFPLASLTWLLRLGIWSDKWRIFVGSGVALSLIVGTIMGLSGNH
ncbi:hypothetical protein CDD82_853 [Ophiocordyceps australis]|uniref:Ubiquitin-like domain-containing protein n=1 Tax=Ophiocordyceps australis TaxID=1399860 RepID=A0A2C5YLC2_9HYPO|nr:hypothetical protein CDD82_853 [Ophiocordyceps australis]